MFMMFATQYEKDNDKVYEKDNWIVYDSYDLNEFPLSAIAFFIWLIHILLQLLLKKVEIYPVFSSRVEFLLGICHIVNLMTTIVLK